MFNLLFAMAGMGSLSLVMAIAVSGMEAAPRSLHPLVPHSTKDKGIVLYPQTELAGWAHEKRQALSWSLQNVYNGTTFFNDWTFFNDPDPTHGLVKYVDRDTAFATGLAFWTEPGVPGIQAEHWTNTSEGTPRNSVRITSNARYAGGLFIIDMAIMPWGCGVWPAFWMLGTDAPWPSAGEIDIIEGIHENSNNQYTLHTSPGCKVQDNASQSYGHFGNGDCSSGNGGVGCSIFSTSGRSFGKNFNDAGGGVVATLWDGNGIRMWEWTRADIPESVNDDHPDPLSWGLPVAAFDRATCDPYQYFFAAQMILNIDLCGDWAGNTYSSTSYCPGTCASQVANANNLANAVMIINSIKTYQQGLPADGGYARMAVPSGLGGSFPYTQPSIGYRTLPRMWSALLWLLVGLCGVLL